MELRWTQKNYIIDNFSIDLSSYDVVIGFRVDDSYFSFAEGFISNTIPLRNLNKALRLGKLGIQTVLLSEKAFGRIAFIDAEFVKKNTYYPKFIARDTNARVAYRNGIRGNHSYRNDIFILDIMREEIKNDDSRIQRILLD